MAEEKAITASALEELLTASNLRGRAGPNVNCLREVLAQLAVHKVSVGVYAQGLATLYAGTIVLALPDCVVIRESPGLNPACVGYNIQPYNSPTTFTFSACKEETVI